jgi:hypothetical protein
MNTEMNTEFPKKNAWNFLTSWETISFSRMILLNESYEHAFTQFAQPGKTPKHSDVRRCSVTLHRRLAQADCFGV